jgi:hypothetical protein
VYIVAFYCQARPTVSSLTFSPLSLVISASGADGSFSERILRYRASLSESLGVIQIGLSLLYFVVIPS